MLDHILAGFISCTRAVVRYYVRQFKRIVVCRFRHVFWTENDVSGRLIASAIYELTVTFFLVPHRLVLEQYAKVLVEISCRIIAVTQLYEGVGFLEAGQVG